MADENIATNRRFGTNQQQSEFLIDTIICQPQIFLFGGCPNAAFSDLGERNRPPPYTMAFGHYAYSTWPRGVHRRNIDARCVTEITGRREIIT